ncbi:hypothetical protein Pla110_46620 [Polystyrenella longa]|uniref:Uncharacterized protein n=2 Tax=Polystyrenella longa TaxID=2528007 RepID=A0A518CUJ5_9PLAN|nr:hypothetical protein Pla110_46620 [Polystyrenella longa]
MDVVAGVHLNEYAIFNSEYSGLLSDTLLTYAEDGDAVIDKNIQSTKILYAPDDISMFGFAVKYKWTTGRGMSKYINTLSIDENAPTEESQNNSSLVRLTGSGFLNPNYSGTWKLIVDVENDYLVREASFFRPKKEIPFVQVKTSGKLIESKPVNLPIAASGSWSHFINGQEIKTDYHHDNFAGSYDKDVYDLVYSRFEEDLPVHSIVQDYRGEEYVSTIVGAKKTKSKERDVNSVKKDKSTTGYYYLILVIAIFAVLLFVFYMRKRSGVKSTKLRKNTP